VRHLGSLVAATGWCVERPSSPTSGIGCNVSRADGQNNANTAGRYSLTHTQATTVKGGYSRDRPYVFCLSLPSGEAVYLAAGTDDLVTEWVNTCNYWSARRSRQPLQGGVGNIEYGWSRVADSHHRRDSASALGTSLDDDRASIRSSSSKMSKFNTATYGRRSFSATPGDRVFINDWKAPPPSLVHSQLEEEAQYEVLRAYHHTLGEELEAHRALEEPMMRLVSLLWVVERGRRRLGVCN